ncbi:unnamed protein product [Absidia cylindrospora]
MRAYIFENSDLNQREPHDSGVEASLEDLKAIGVLYWKFDGPDALQQIDALSVERKYKNRDEKKSSLSLLNTFMKTKKLDTLSMVPATLTFATRMMYGCIAMGKGDMIILPAGMYHRFTTDSKNYLKAMRLFKEDPLWTPINRPLADDNKHRSDYLSHFNITAP